MSVAIKSPTKLESVSSINQKFSPNSSSPVRSCHGMRRPNLFILGRSFDDHNSTLQETVLRELDCLREIDGALSWHLERLSDPIHYLLFQKAESFFP